ncbi:hypothetical protein [Blastococcus sp. SYSU D00813]
MTARDLASRLLALRVVKDWIAAEERDLRAAAAGDLVVGERVTGLADPDDKQSVLGFVQLTKARQSWGIADPDALIEWVAEHAPSELVTVPAREDVRASFVAALVDSVKKHGGWLHPDTGELIPVDGVECRTGEPVLTVKPTAEADGLVREAIAARRLQLTPGGAS